MTAADKTERARPANDNGRRKALRLQMDLPAFLPIQRCEIEVMTELLESHDVPANDNEVS